MDLRQLRYFIGISDAGSLLQASRLLHVAQPALGQQMSALEQSVGAKLLVRSNRGVTLTQAGKVLLEHARLILADAERAKEAVRDIAIVPQGEVVVGLPTTIALATTVPLLRRCQQQYPRVRLKIVEGYSGFLREWLADGRLDFAILFGDEPDKGLEKQALLDEQLVFVTSPGALPARGEVSLEHISRLPLVLPSAEHGLRRTIEDACRPLGLSLNVIAEVESLTNVKKVVEAGLGSTILPPVSVSAEVLNGSLQTASISSDGMARRVVCASNITRPTTTSNAVLARLVCELIQEMVQAGTWQGEWIGPDAVS